MRRNPLVFVAISIIVVTAGRASGELRRIAVADLRAAAAAVPVGEIVRIDGLVDLTAARAETLVAERFEVFTPDARVVVMTDGGPVELAPPANVYLKGALEGVAGSRVLLSVHENGVVRGIAADWAGVSLILPAAAAAGGVELRRVDPADHHRPFGCDVDRLGSAELVSRLAAPAPAAGESPSTPPPAHTARVAIETDHEFFQQFGNAPDAASYIADVIAYESILYEDEVNTSLRIPYARLWSTAADPWTQVSPTCNLYQFGKVWNDTQGAVPRTIAHMMSGRTNGGGVAWVGVLCSGPFNVDTAGAGCSFADISNYGGAYGYTGEMDGGFLYESPGVLWDVVATAHEIGHNYNSPHTHCYATLGGNPSQVDVCYNGQCGSPNCSCAPQALPGPGSTTGGSPGAGNGTIMSYCHGLTGGLANISYTFGEGHPFGAAPQRVPDRMMAHVASVAGTAPACLAFVPGSSVIFRDGVDQGSASNWSSIVP